MEYSSKIFPLVAVLLILVSFVDIQAFASTFAVGGSQGWDQSTDFKGWASSKTFKVGDLLEFKYTAAMHSVVELPNEAAFKSCDISSPLKSYSTGDDKITLGGVGTRYFACGTSGHCEQGMKVKIATVAANGSSSTTTSPSSPPTTSASSHQVQFITFFALGASLTPFFM